MAKVKYDVTGVESGGTGSPPPPGIYVAELAECEQGESKAGNEQLVCKFEISRGDFKGYPLWEYVGFAENQAWKMRQFLEAVWFVQGKKEKGTLDTVEVLGTECQLKLKHETYEGEAQARIKVMLPMPEDDEEEEEELEEEEETEVDEITLEEVEEMDLDDLKDVIEEEDLEIKVTKRSKVDTIRAKVAEELGLEEDEEEEGDAEEDGDDEADYDEWEVAELKEELKERGLKATGKKATLVKRLEDNDEEEDPF